jgi:hypothetical protein
MLDFLRSFIDLDRIMPNFRSFCPSDQIHCSIAFIQIIHIVANSDSIGSDLIASCLLPPLAQMVCSMEAAIVDRPNSYFRMLNICHWLTQGSIRTLNTGFER